MYACSSILLLFLLPTPGLLLFREGPNAQPPRTPPSPFLFLYYLYRLPRPALSSLPFFIPPPYLLIRHTIFGFRHTTLPPKLDSPAPRFITSIRLALFYRALPSSVVCCYPVALLPSPLAVLPRSSHVDFILLKLILILITLDAAAQLPPSVQRFIGPGVPIPTDKYPTTQLATL